MAHPVGGIGSSIPFGPWNMGVLWVVVRGWGIPNIPATSGIALYGVVNELSRLFLPLFAIAVLALTGDLAGKKNAGTAWTIAIISAVAFVVVTALIVAIVRSERVADWLGRTGSGSRRGSCTSSAGRKRPTSSGAIHRFRDQLGLRHPSAGLRRARHGDRRPVRLDDRPHRRAPDVRGARRRPDARAYVFGVYALVMVITIIPLSPGGAGVPELLFISAFTAIAGEQYNAAITAGVFLYRLYFWFLPIPLAWILLKVARRGKSMLPTTAELRAAAH